MKKIMIQKITQNQNNWNFWTVNLIMRAKNCYPVVRFSGTLYRLVPSQKKHCILHRTIHNIGYRYLLFAMSLLRYLLSVVPEISDRSDTSFTALQWEFCLSVCQTRALWQNGREICPDFYTIWKII